MADFLEWDKRYRVEDRAADAEHQKIVHLMNIFLDGLAAAKAPKILDAMLEQIIDVGRAHFKNEEAEIKQRLERAEFFRHKERHDNLIRELRMLKDGYEQAKLGVDDILPFFRLWIFDHIEQSDQPSFAGEGDRD